MSVIDFEKARAARRPTITVGGRYPFYSTLHGSDGHGVTCRLFTGQTVTVIDYHPAESEDADEQIFTVRADSGCMFSAFEGELDGFYKDTGQFYNADGSWGPDREVF